jgi:hypothetical protein
MVISINYENGKRDVKRMWGVKYWVARVDRPDYISKYQYGRIGIKFD